MRRGMRAASAWFAGGWPSGLEQRQTEPEFAARRSLLLELAVHRNPVQHGLTGKTRGTVLRGLDMQLAQRRAGPLFFWGVKFPNVMQQLVICLVLWASEGMLLGT